jgi:hypothetical protein
VRFIDEISSRTRIQLPMFFSFEKKIIINFTKKLFSEAFKVLVTGVLVFYFIFVVLFLFVSSELECSCCF